MEWSLSRIIVRINFFAYPSRFFLKFGKNVKFLTKKLPLPIFFYQCISFCVDKFSDRGILDDFNALWRPCGVRRSRSPADQWLIFLIQGMDRERGPRAVDRRRAAVWQCGSDGTVSAVSPRQIIRRGWEVFRAASNSTRNATLINFRRISVAHTLTRVTASAAIHGPSEYTTSKNLVSKVWSSWRR